MQMSPIRKGRSHLPGDGIEPESLLTQDSDAWLSAFWFARPVGSEEIRSQYRNIGGIGPEELRLLHRMVDWSYDRDLAPYDLISVADWAKTHYASSDQFVQVRYVRLPIDHSRCQQNSARVQSNTGPAN